MTSDKDYYRILGVLDDAEDIVIKAAYRALAQRYHPDKWQGDPAEATRRMAEINAAYAVLSDTAKRAAYDAQRDKSQFASDDSDTSANDGAADISAINKDWDFAKKYHPNLAEIERQLSAIAHALGYTFKLTLLETKRFADSALLAKELEQKYLRKYFSSDPATQAFAKELILEGRRDAAKELNDAIRVFGKVGYAEMEKIVRNFRTQSAPVNIENRLALAMKIVQALRKEPFYFYEVVGLVSTYATTCNRKIEVVHEKTTFFSGDKLRFLVSETSGQKNLSPHEAIDWFLNDSR